MDENLAELLEKLHCGGTLGRRAMILERLAAACGVDRDRCQKLTKLPGRAGIEMAIGAAGETGDLLEGPLGLRLAPVGFLGCGAARTALEPALLGRRGCAR